ncbi:MAG: fibronectin type III domain-containing protein [Myxococcota bacterium]
MRTWLITGLLACGAPPPEVDPEPPVEPEDTGSIEPPPPQNEAPGAPSLLDPADGSPYQPLALVLSWTEAVDPDGDVLTYEVRLDTVDPPQQVVASALDATTWSVADLEPETAYTWQVVARDPAGAEAASEVRSFSTQATVAAMLLSTAPWGERENFGAEVFAGRIWVVAGTACCGGTYDDVWSSPDGITWTEEVANAPFGSRGQVSTAVHDGQLWLVGGRSGASPSGAFDDVWSSEDGVTWTQVPTTDLPRIHSAELAVHDGRMWLLGGRDNEGNRYADRVWSSVDGQTWDEVLVGAPTFRDRVGELVAHDGALWYVGGRNDRVESTLDGVTWTRQTSDALFGLRGNHTAVSHDDRLWVISGFDDDNSFILPDVYYSEDGATWVQAAVDAGFVPVASAEAVSFQGALLLLGGGGSSGSNFFSSDVYQLD